MSQIRAMLRRFGWRTLLSHAVGIACAGALTAGAWIFRDAGWETVREHPYFAITEVKVRGTGELLERTAVLRWLGVTDSMSSWDASPIRWRRRLEAHPMIAHADVRREFPGRYEIEVRERQPRALVVLDDLFYVDRAGNAFGPLAAHHSLDYPVITGVDHQMAPGYRRWLLRRALRLVRLCERIACFGGLSEIHLDPVLGPVLYPSTPAVPVILGWGSWQEKIDRAVRALDEWRGRETTLANVDARFRDQVIVRFTDPGEADGPDVLRADRSRRGEPSRQRPPEPARKQPAQRRGMRV